MRVLTPLCAPVLMCAQDFITYKVGATDFMTSAEEFAAVGKRCVSACARVHAESRARACYACRRSDLKPADETLRGRLEKVRDMSLFRCACACWRAVDACRAKSAVQQIWQHGRLERDPSRCARDQPGDRVPRALAHDIFRLARWDQGECISRHVGCVGSGGAPSSAERVWYGSRAAIGVHHARVRGGRAPGRWEAFHVSSAGADWCSGGVTRTRHAGTPRGRTAAGWARRRW